MWPKAWTMRAEVFRTIPQTDRSLVFTVADFGKILRNKIVSFGFIGRLIVPPTALSFLPHKVPCAECIDARQISWRFELLNLNFELSCKWNCVSCLPVSRPESAPLSTTPATSPPDNTFSETRFSQCSQPESPATNDLKSLQLSAYYMNKHHSTVNASKEPSHRIFHGPKCVGSFMHVHTEFLSACMCLSANT